MYKPYILLDLIHAIQYLLVQVAIVAVQKENTIYDDYRAIIQNNCEESLKPCRTPANI